MKFGKIENEIEYKRLYFCIITLSVCIPIFISVLLHIYYNHNIEQLVKICVSFITTNVVGISMIFHVKIYGVRI